MLFAGSVTVTVDVDAAKVINTFKPYDIFGNNTSGWASPVPVKDKIQAAGNYVLRYPGGSWGDAFFWNSKGTFDTQGNWVPSLEEYENSSTGDLVYGQDKIIDGDNSTAWRTNADTDFPDGQWVYFDLQEKKNPDKVEIIWGNTANKSWPYAKKVTVQYWDPLDGRQWMPYDADKSSWLNTSAAKVEGTGGTQEIKFKPANTQYVRILMSESSAGKNGTYAISGLKVFEKGAELLPKDKNSVVVSSCNTAAGPGNGASWIFGFEKYMEFMNSFGPVKASPLIIVNMGSGTPQMAAAWVKYANKIKGYGIKYWEVGNENGGQWETGGPMNMYDYTRRYIKFYEAMKAVDPSITIIAQAQADGKSGMYDGVSAIEAFMGRLAKEKKEHYAEGLVTHQYPNWGQQLADLLASPKKGMADTAAQVKKGLEKYPKFRDIPIWITEFNTSDQVKPQDISVHLENGLWLAQYMPEFIRQFGSRGHMNMWDVLNGGTAITNPTGGDHGYMQAEAGPNQYQERADYWTMKMMTNYWSSPGDLNDHRLVDSASTESKLAVYANLKPNGTLALMAVNTDPENTFDAAISVKGFVPQRDAKTWKFDKDNYQWKTDAQPYYADPDEPPSESNINNAGEKFSYSFKPYSITVLELKSK
jgi:alpha-L-arabinofuranosidase